MSLTITALGKEERPALWFLNTLTIVKATSRQTGGAFGLIEPRAPVGVGSPYHVHRAEEERFCILEGELEFLLLSTTISPSLITILAVSRFQ